jgi:hypothetical protein
VRKVIVAGFVAALTALGAGAALAQGPGPNGHNNHGLCTAYFNGSATGQAHKQNAGPFQALEAAADDGNSNTTPQQDVWNWCNDTTNNPKGIGGTPTNPNG